MRAIHTFVNVFEITLSNVYLCAEHLIGMGASRTVFFSIASVNII